MNPIVESLNNYASANDWGGVRAGGQPGFPAIRHRSRALTGKIGHNEGYTAYKLSFLLADKEEPEGAAGNEETLKCLRQHVSGMIRTLESHPQVRQARLTGCEPALSPSGAAPGKETALAVTVEVDIRIGSTPVHA